MVLTEHILQEPIRPAVLAKRCGGGSQNALLISSWAKAKAGLAWCQSCSRACRSKAPFLAPVPYCNEAVACERVGLDVSSCHRHDLTKVMVRATCRIHTRARASSELASLVILPPPMQCLDVCARTPITTHQLKVGLECALKDLGLVVWWMFDTCFLCMWLNKRLVGEWFWFTWSSSIFKTFWIKHLLKKGIDIALLMNKPYPSSGPNSMLRPRNLMVSTSPCWRPKKSGSG